MASNDFDFSSIEWSFVASDGTVNSVDCFDGLLVGGEHKGLLVVFWDLTDRGLGASLAAADERGPIKSNGTSLPRAMSASAANLQPFELGLRSSACCRSKPVVGMDTFKFS